MVFTNNLLFLFPIFVLSFVLSSVICLDTTISEDLGVNCVQGSARDGVYCRCRFPNDEVRVDKLPERLRELRISHCGKVEFGAMTLHNLRDVEMTFIGSVFLNGSFLVPNIRKWRFSDIQEMTISRNSIRYVRQSLDFMRVDVVKMETESFANLTLLKTLTFVDCRFSKIESRAMEVMTSGASVARFLRCNFDDIAPESFMISAKLVSFENCIFNRGLPLLGITVISSIFSFLANTLPSIQDSALVVSSNQLTIERNTLGDLSGGAFRGLSASELLTIKDNMIGEVSPRALDVRVSDTTGSSGTFAGSKGIFFNILNNTFTPCSCNIFPLDIITGKVNDKPSESLLQSYYYNFLRLHTCRKADASRESVDLSSYLANVCVGSATSGVSSTSIRTTAAAAGPIHTAEPTTLRPQQSIIHTRISAANPTSTLALTTRIPPLFNSRNFAPVPTSITTTTTRPSTTTRGFTTATTRTYTTSTRKYTTPIPHTTTDTPDETTISNNRTALYDPINRKSIIKPPPKFLERIGESSYNQQLPIGFNPYPITPPAPIRTHPTVALVLPPPDSNYNEEPTSQRNFVHSLQQMLVTRKAFVVTSRPYNPFNARTWYTSSYTPLVEAKLETTTTIPATTTEEDPKAEESETQLAYSEISKSINGVQRFPEELVESDETKPPVVVRASPTVLIVVICAILGSLIAAVAFFLRKEVRRVVDTTL